jgi:hypothetical protein
MSTLTLFPTQIVTEAPEATSVTNPVNKAPALPQPDAGLRLRLAPIRLFATASGGLALIHLALASSGFATEVVLGMEALALASVWLVVSLQQSVATLAVATLNLLLVLALVHPANGLAPPALMLQAVVVTALIIAHLTRVAVVWNANDFPQLKGML